VATETGALRSIDIIVMRSDRFAVVDNRGTRVPVGGRAAVRDRPCVARIRSVPHENRRIPHAGPAVSAPLFEIAPGSG